MKPYSWAITAAILSSVLSSLDWIFRQQSIRDLSPLVCAAFLNVFGSIAVFLILRHKERLPALEKIKQNFKSILHVAFFRTIFASVVFSYVMTMSDGTKLMFLTKLEPYLVIFWSWVLLNTRPQISTILLLAVQILGTFLLSTSGNLEWSKSQLGDLIAVCALIVVSYGYRPATKLALNLGALSSNLATMTVAAIVLLPFAITFSPAPFWELPLRGWAYLLVSVLSFQVVGLSLWFVALKSLDGWVVSALRAIGPLIATGITFLFFGQTLDSIQLTGGALVLASCAAIAWDQKGRSV